MKRKSKIGKRILQRLVELEKDPAWLAKELSVQPCRVFNLLTQEGYHTKTLVRLSKVLDIHPSYFFN